MDILLTIRSKTDGTEREVKCPIGEGLAVGRGAEDGVLLDGPDLSREHFLLSTDGTNFYVTDTSSNGTWLNGNRLQRSAKTRVRPEDSIEVPGYVVKVKAAVEPEQTDEAAVAQVAAAVPVRFIPPPEPEKPKGNTVSRFIGSFSFMEKFLLLVGLTGLALLFTYMAS
jgi:predicted component of type VI protein secretion system